VWFGHGATETISAAPPPHPQSGVHQGDLSAGGSAGGRDNRTFGYGRGIRPGVEDDQDTGVQVEMVEIPVQLVASRIDTLMLKGEEETSR
jgi:hypothetical protein